VKLGIDGYYLGDFVDECHIHTFWWYDYKYGWLELISYYVIL